MIKSYYIPRYALEYNKDDIILKCSCSAIWGMWLPSSIPHINAVRQKCRQCRQFMFSDSIILCYTVLGQQSHTIIELLEMMGCDDITL